MVRVVCNSLIYEGILEFDNVNERVILKNTTACLTSDYRVVKIPDVVYIRADAIESIGAI
jgi:hypothetical protein